MVLLGKVTQCIGQREFLFAVAENIVSFVYLFKLNFRFLISRIHIGMVLFCKLSVSLFYLDLDIK